MPFILLQDVVVESARSVLAYVPALYHIRRTDV